MAHPRDPVSEAFDAAARRLLERAYAARGQWVQAWLPDPTVRQRTRWIEIGINVDAPDNGGSAAGGGAGGLDAKTRWARGFVRSLNYQHKWWSGTSGRGWRQSRRTAPRSAGGLRVEIGRHVPGNPGGGLPPRRRVRVKLEAGGAAKARAVARLADRDRIFDDADKPAGRWSNPALRDWA